MSRPSFKVRLVDALELRIAELERELRVNPESETASALVAEYRDDLRRLRGRGSGPLPSWARRRADELGIAPPTKASSTSS
jgi:uncharacterized protein YceH (UPF0502 family)